MAKMFKFFAVVGLLVTACNAGEELPYGQVSADVDAAYYDEMPAPMSEAEYPDIDAMASGEEFGPMPSADEMFPPRRQVPSRSQLRQAPQAAVLEDDLSGLASEEAWADSYATLAEDLAATEFARASNVTEYSPSAQDSGTVEDLAGYESEADFETPVENASDWMDAEPNQEGSY